MITSILEFRNNITNDAIESLKWQNHKYVYHATAHGKMFGYLYGMKSIGDPRKIFYNPPKNTEYVIQAGGRDRITKQSCSCWTLDPDYTWVAFNDSIPIRLVFEIDKMKDIQNRFFYGDGNINEMEVRIADNILNWTKYLYEIQTTEKFFNEDFEDGEMEITFGAFKLWLPQELHKYCKFYEESYFDQQGIGNEIQKIIGNNKTYQDIGFK